MPRRPGRPCGKRASAPLRGLAALLVIPMALSLVSSPGWAQQPVKIGIGFGLAFLPLYICEDLKLVEKHAKAAHFDVKASYPRLLGAGPIQDAIASGAIDMGPFGTAPLLAAWEKAKNTRQQIVAVSGITSLPMTLLSNRSNVQSLADLKPSDRIAMPTLSAPQMYVLEMQSEKSFGQYDKLRAQVVALSHPDAIEALAKGSGSVTAYFSSEPFTQLALRDTAIHKVLSSEDVMGGKASFLIMGATKTYIDAHPKIAEVIEQAIDEAARLIHDDPRRAAQIFLTHEPSKTLDAAAIAAILTENADEFGSAVYGVDAFAAFMSKHGELKSPPESWKEVVAPPLLNSPST